MMKQTMFMVAVASLGACANVPTKREVGQSNLEYKSNAEGTSTGKAMGFVLELETPDAAEVAKQPSNNPLTAMIQASMIQAQAGEAAGWNARLQLAQDYPSQLRRAMENGLYTMLSQRGFNTMGPFKSLDDMTYPQRKEAYMVSVSRLDIDVAQKRTELRCKSGYCTDKGQFQITGELNLRLMEPISKEVILNKRINLSDFNVSKTYIKMFKQPGYRTNLPGKLFDVFSRPDELADNTDKALSDAINEFYAQAMGKVDSLLSREEILSQHPLICRLKQKFGVTDCKISSGQPVAGVN